ncbi:uncharacterized protein FIBRA_04818 [Fibroporia radiculosa]|uniref:Uncharacterized protein n=1 Tax=Fibroporia radiculosa TaxID=599839 RepID=J4HWR3_9APHY|nr:uncharacterized protein FIBRA_04818 [Fibroporia radiculosa]CCM02712.1 predicted protein [Fibroporia radiculosa]
MPSTDGADFVPTLHNDTYSTINPAYADLAGKVALVTGASKGIGRATALALAQAGVSGLVLLARSDTSIVKAECEAVQRSGKPLTVITAAADVSNTTDIAGAVALVQSVFGRLDIVVNNAGCLETYHLVADSDPDEWWSIWNVNIRGVYEVTRACIPLLLECDGDKTIINITSRVAHVTGSHLSAYMTTKLALLRFTELVMAEYAGKGLLVYAVHPGSIPTDIQATMPQKYRHVLVDTLELASHTIVWLLRERREWLGGRYISCQWDVDGLLAKREEIVEGDKLKIKMVL